MKAVIVGSFGGPEVLRYADLPDPEIGPGDVLVRMRVVGLNFADIYRRRGEAPVVPPAPPVLGYEGAGVVERVGAGVSGFRPGDRVGFADVPRANAELVCARADRLIPLAAETSFEDAAALLLQGLSAHFLTHESHALRPGETVAIHAAAGGVGGLLAQIAKIRGAARIFGIVSSEPKAEVARELGCEPILVSDDWVRALRARTGERGVDVVYDGTGATLSGSLDAARVGGTVVYFGSAGGNPPLIDPGRLLNESKRVAGGDLWNHVAEGELQARAAELFGWVRAGRLRVRIDSTFPLKRAAEAHARLESRAATGKVLLTVA